VEEAIKKGKDFKLEGALGNMQCPYRILRGSHDVLGVKQATKIYEHAKGSGGGRAHRVSE
jgi:hypothetical protein